MTTTTRGPGRPRNEHLDQAILEATIDELIERGFLALSMESIAARAGVAKTTLYRRWSNALDLSVAAMRSLEQLELVPPDQAVRDQLVWMIDAMRRRWENPRFAAVMRRVLADGTVKPELFFEGRERLVGPHLAVMNGLVARAAAEGVIRADVDVDVTRWMMTAPVVASNLMFSGPVSREQVEFVVDTVLAGLKP